LEKRLIPEVAQNGTRGILRRILRTKRIFTQRIAGGIGSRQSLGAGTADTCRAAFKYWRDADGIELDASSCDHLEYLKPADVRAIAKSKTVATLLPGCNFHLGLERYAPARRLIDAGAIVALATDFNPGTSPTLSMPMILSLACTQLRMTPAEAITAATINAAYSLGREKRIGFDRDGQAGRYGRVRSGGLSEIPYYFGVSHCWMTMKRGEMVYLRD